jgi:hypothetical protein
LPAPHALHDVCPAVGCTHPIGHAAHAVAPLVPALKLPDAQPAHVASAVDEPAEKNWPGPHDVLLA